MKLLFKIILVLVLIGIAYYLYIDYRFENKSISNKLSSTEIWGHRGLVNHDTVFENSLQSFANALEKGAEGIEMDIFFDDSLKTFVVTHDYPYKKQKDNSLLLLSTVLDSFENSTHYWLDLKNLNNENTNKIAEELNTLLSKNNRKQNVYIETGNTLPGIQLSKKYDLNILLWIQYNRTNKIIKTMKKWFMKWALVQGNFKGITIGYIFYDNDFISTFKNTPLFLFHINEKNEIEKVKNEYPKLSVVLVDSSNLYTHKKNEPIK